MSADRIVVPPFLVIVASAPVAVSVSAQDSDGNRTAMNYDDT